jgi:aminomuconate-semialdehyde/2-hydroxymuconate-6-semialdehyde dehydrogenase
VRELGLLEHASEGQVLNYIGGEFVPAQAGRWLEDLDPARNRRIASIPRSESSDVDDAANAASEARRGAWGQSGVGERADLLEAVADKIEARLDDFARLESLDTGKPFALARSVDIPRAVANFRFFAGAVRHQSTGCHSMANALNYTVRKPVGTFGLITPWNLPLYLLSWKTAPALAMGNCVVAKPSELTPLTASALAEVFSEIGAPAGCFNLVHGLGAEVGQAIVEHEDITGISFTGGTETGKRVAATAAPMFKKLSLELGGKNPSIVFADCDLEKTVEGVVRAAFANQGQVCLCGSRILVERSIYDQFSAAFVERVRELRPGDPQQGDTNFGALISLGHRDKVEGYAKLAAEEGGEILCGGKRPELSGDLAEGAFFEPTVVAGLAPSSRCSTEEIFGPVVTLHPFDTEAEALEIANGVRYGLAASVWTNDLTRAHRVSEAIESGMVWVNTWLLRDLRVPFGGMKDSGVGREGGRHSLEFFSETRNICIQL